MRRALGACLLGLGCLLVLAAPAAGESSRAAAGGPEPAAAVRAPAPLEPGRGAARPVRVCTRARCAPSAGFRALHATSFAAASLGAVWVARRREAARG